jgi:peptidoglycan/xylan/chitin deacetylase (PgdA/CDA1 family)
MVAFWLILTLLPVSGVATAAAVNPLPNDDYDRLKAGTKITQERVYEQPDQPTVYLTFDDGPGKLTPAVLDILKEEQVPATFFVLGEYVNQYPEHVKRMVAEGHAIGNHTYNHQYQNLYPSYALFKAQIEKTEQALLEKAGVTTSLIRAPGGTFSHFDAFYFYYLDQAGYSVFDWNVDSGDARRANVPSKDIIHNVTSTPLKHEMNVLMHDSSGHEETVRALPAIISFYKEKGYQFARLSPKVKPVQSIIDRRIQTAQLTKEEHEYWVANARMSPPHNTAERPPAIKQPPVIIAQVPSAESLAAEALAREDEKSVAVLKRQNEWAVEESAAALRKLHVPPLQLELGHNNILEMASPRYEFRQDKFYVPLRALAERMGALVTWEEDTRTATVSYGLYQMEVDLQRNSISVQAPGRNKQVYYLADVKVNDGSIMVPLRSSVEMLGNHVAGYSIGDTLRQVKVDLISGGYGLLCAPKTMFRV